ncbi:MAG: oligopeptide transporter, OPT family [Synergistaceae bacterium]|nr:oligopeptide transporter, OPT family [Synergistaceae bacterium]
MSDYKPYIPPEMTQPELTTASIITGALLAIVFGAANAYLGLRVGLTVSASIPAAVISMVVMRVILRRSSLLESNMVQTIGSAGEALAGGAIFTMPVFFLWAAEDVVDMPELVTLSVLAVCGGVIGVLLMIPLRHHLIVTEHELLPYPEGTACAKVLLAAEQTGSGSQAIFAGMGIAALSKFLTDGLKIIPGTVTAKIEALKTEFSAEAYPDLIAVGYIVGARISAYMLSGGLLGWFVIIPLLVSFGDETVIFPASKSIAELYASGGAGAIWSSYVRYIGAGMVAAGGLFSLIKSLPSIITSFSEAFRGMSTDNSTTRTEQNLSLKLALAIIAALLAALIIIEDVPVSFSGALMILLFGFFFGAVSARIVGIVGSSNTPVSGMTIAAMLLTTLIFKLIGLDAATGMISAISVGVVICIIMAISSDTSQDLKTGFLLGATPKKQQIGEIIGVTASAIVIGGVLILLHSAWGFGSKEMPAPQAALMKILVEGVMSENLPWSLIFIGAFLAVVVELLGVMVLPVAIGLYLPLELSVTVMIGGIVRWLSDYLNRNHANHTNHVSDEGTGILFCSGLVAGEGLLGILLALAAVLGLADKIDLSGYLYSGPVGGVALIFLLSVAIMYYSKENKVG